MHEFGRELERAMDAYVNKHYGSDCSHDCSEETETKIRKLLQKEDNSMRKNSKKLTRWIGVIAACAVLMCSAVVVYAASPAVREYLNMLFLKEDSIARLTEVPEGYTGIYTAEDLDNVRNDLYGNYILMNDIVLTEEDYLEGGIFEGGFVPIGTDGYPFKGIFNGNGYVISGLVINGDYEYAGLFGYVKRNYNNFLSEDYVDGEIGPNGEIVGLTKTFDGIVKNLGVVNSVISISTDAVSQAHVGGIAGYADFMVGCFTENTEISLHLGERTNDGTHAVGGVVGAGFIIDSCYSDADITVTADKDIAEIYTAGVAGQSFACVTSYFDGTIDCGDYSDYGVTSTYNLIVPMVLPEIAIDEIESRYREKLAETAGVDVSEITETPIEVMKLKAFYLSLHPSNLDEEFQFFMKDMEGERVLLLDPDTKAREHRMLSSIIEAVFPDNTFNRFCMENNLKCGYYYCYDLRETPDCTFEGFDTESIWYMADGRPQLRLFSGGTVGLSTESAQERPRLGWQKGLFLVEIPT